jgi:hypothetical protein
MGGVIPTNLTHKTTLSYWLNKSKAEIEKLGLTVTIEVAKRTMKANIMEALEFLKQYDVSYEELEELIKKKIKDKP